MGRQKDCYFFTLILAYSASLHYLSTIIDNTLNTTKMRLFLTDYASYNNGTQFEFGHWVDLTDFSDASEFLDYVAEHLEECDKKSPIAEHTQREEPMFTDYEGFPSNLYSESMSEADIQGIYDYIEAVDNSHLDQDAIDAYINHIGGTPSAEMIEDAEEAYQGQYDKDEDFAYQFAEELGYLENNTSWPHSCIDWEYAARELMYDYFESNGYYFRSM